MERFTYAVLNHARELEAGFEHAVRIAMHEAHIRSGRRRPQEPDYVAMLVLESAPYLAATMRALIGREVRATITGVFCHQSPIVEFNRRQDRCELGDVLIVHRCQDYSGAPVRNNSLLLQAKLASGDTHQVGAAEKHQLRLYSAWPVFKYCRSGSRLNGNVRNVTPKISHSGAQYLLINRQDPMEPGAGHLGLSGTYSMSVWPAATTLYPNCSLAGELVRFLVGNTGRRFFDNPASDASAWSSVVWDLLTQAGMHVFTRTNIEAKGVPRVAGDSLSSSLTKLRFALVGYDTQNDSPIADQLGDRFRKLLQERGHGPPNDPSNFQNDQDSSDGCSLLLIETRDLD